MGIDVDPHDKGLGGAPVKCNLLNKTAVRDSKEDLHIAIDLATDFSHKLKQLHPVAQAHIKHLIINCNFI